MIGVPGVGKSTWIKNNVFNDSVILSTDDLIEIAAQESGLTYNEVFEDNIENATKKFFDSIKFHVSKENSIIIDKTNLNIKSRKRILNLIPDTYKKVAIVINCSDPFIHATRLMSRKGKIIPEHVFDSMIKSFQPPTLEEGFDDINIFDTAPQMEEIE